MKGKTMASAGNGVCTDGLREEIRRPIHQFARKILEVLGNRLESISVVGSSLGPDYIPGRSDINTVVVVRDGLLESLEAIALQEATFRRKGFACPLLLDAGYLHGSQDSFPIELLDFQLSHCTVFGDDPFEKLIVSRNDVRLQCERELRSVLVRLSQGYIACGGNTDAVAELLVACVSGLAPLIRAMLWLKGVDRSGSFGEVFAKAGQAFSVDEGPLTEIRRWKSARRPPSRNVVIESFKLVYGLVERLTAQIDTLEQ
jgi:hypothetical protein